MIHLTNVPTDEFFFYAMDIMDKCVARWPRVIFKIEWSASLDLPKNAWPLAKVAFKLGYLDAHMTAEDVAHSYCRFIIDTLFTTDWSNANKVELTQPNRTPLPSREFYVVVYVFLEPRCPTQIKFV